MPDTFTTNTVLVKSFQYNWVKYIGIAKDCREFWSKSWTEKEKKSKKTTKRQSSSCSTFLKISFQALNVYDIKSVFHLMQQ